MLIVLEGLDGAGKSTQVKRLKAWLETIPQGLDYIHFPRYDSPVYGGLITRFLKGEFGDNGAVHPQLVALLFAEDRRAAADEIRASLEKGRFVLLDRYVYSNIAYQCAKTDSPEETERLRRWILDTEYKEFGIPKPDLNLFLDVPISFVEQQLRAQREGSDRDYLQGGRDIHEQDIRFQERVREMYVRECEADPAFLRIDCRDEQGNMLPADSIEQRVRAVVESAVSVMK
ncbi:MAG: dTMP kinase [Bacteroidales bacterium]|nr:dTMP kinase [Bacteroidales bacterium]